LKSYLMMLAIGLAVSTPAFSERTDQLINSGWMFHKGDVEATAEVDSTWTAVDLPHTWNAEDGQDGGSDFWRGAAWYRKQIELPAMERKRLYLHFEAALTTTEAFVNGVSAGTHSGGYAAFRFEITDLVKAGENTLSIRVDNSHDPDVPPLSGDWTFFGGIYRDLHLITVDPVHVDLMDYGSPGVYLTQEEITKEKAKVELRTTVVNQGEGRTRVRLRADVLAPSGETVKSIDESKRVNGGDSHTFKERIEIKDPHLWDGQADPFTYTVRVTVTGDDGSRDVVEQPLGLRTFRVSPNRGFFLNGKYTKLQGVNRHQDRLDMGNALTDAEHEEDFALIREMGANTIRLAHYQHADYFYDLCDADGQIVWAELALVNGVTDSDAFRENAKQQLRELIRQNYNRPSIVMWSIFNEIRVSERFLGATADANPLLVELDALSKEEDPTRLNVSAAMTDPEDPVAQITDLQSFNRYHGWYYANAEDFGPWIDGVHEAYPTGRLGISEYGAGASASFHSEDPIAQDHTEEWQNHFHEVWWQAIEARPFIWGSHIWNMFDFASDMRDEGDHKGRNDKGLVTFDRKIKKDAFHYYKANWTDTPVVHLTSKRFNPRKVSSIDVKVYSNLASVSLQVNGRQLGNKMSDNHIYVWEDVELLLGDNQVIATGHRDGRTFVDRATWTRKRSEEASVVSDRLTIHEGAKLIVNPPHSLDVFGLLAAVSTSTGATAAALGEGDQPSPEGDTVDANSVVLVTAEDGIHTSRYTVVYGAASLGRPVEASSHSPGGWGFPPAPPGQANDGDPETAWLGAFQGPYWLTLDLGTEKYIDRIEFVWPSVPEKEDPGHLTYKVGLSRTGADFEQAVDRLSNEESARTTDRVGKVSRFVKVTLDSSTVTRTLRLFERDIEFTQSGIAEATVHGGLMVSDIVSIDYVGRKVKGAGMSDAELMAKCGGVNGATLSIQESDGVRWVIAVSSDGNHQEAYTIE